MIKVLSNISKLIFIALLLVTNIVVQASSTSSIASQLKLYLREIKAVAVDFIQQDSRSKVTYGKLLINKPYKFRCNYYPPFPLLIVGNKSYVSVYDYDMEQINIIKPQDNVFNFLLEDEIDLEKDFAFESIRETGHLLKITIVHKASERKSNITFDKQTKALKTLEIIEDDNVITITFDKIKKVSEFSQDLFNIKNPDIFGSPERLNKKDIEKKYKLQS
jgi:outer membrane lipoprotein-sorting protein